MPSALHLGTLLVVDLENPSWTRGLARSLGRLQPTGVIVRSQAARSRESAAALLARVAKSLGAAPLLALDEEGGGAARSLIPPLPAPNVVAAKGPQSAARLGDLIGSALGLIGFNAHLGPVLDLAAPAPDPQVAARAFGADPGAVADCAAAYLTALKAHHVIACGRHFPGLGAARFDSAEKRLVVARPMAELWREDLRPYRALADRLPLVEVSGAAYKAYDYDLPRAAALSPSVVDGLLRTKLGYRGVVLADLRKIAAAGEPLGAGAAAVKAFAAGCDLVRVPGLPTAEIVLEELERALAAGALSSERLRHSVKRIDRVRKSVQPPKGAMAAKAWDTLARRSEGFVRECGGPIG